MKFRNCQQKKNQMNEKTFSEKTKKENPRADSLYDVGSWPIAPRQVIQKPTVPPITFEMQIPLHKNRQIVLHFIQSLVFPVPLLHKSIPTRTDFLFSVKE